MDKCLNNSCVQFTVRLLRWIPVVFVLLVMTWAYYVYVFHICFGLVESVLQRVIFLTIFHFLFVSVAWSYFQTVFTPLGLLPSSFCITKEVKDDLSAAGDEREFRVILDRFVRQNKVPVLNRAFEGGPRFCIKCSVIKPDRSHHCSICGRCILKFDHHCPWVNTCINFNNYKFFILFLGYAFSLCAFGFFSILPYFVMLWRNNEFSHGLITFQVLFLFFVAGMFGISIGCLFFYHLYLTGRNQSTLESFRPPMFNYGVDKNAYNLGIRRNFCEVFGKNRLLWFFPVATTPGDGIEYPQVGGVIESSLSTSFDVEYNNGNVRTAGMVGSVYYKDLTTMNGGVDGTVGGLPPSCGVMADSSVASGPTASTMAANNQIVMNVV